MKFEIIKIEDNIVACKLEDGYILDIDKKWFQDEIKVGDICDIDISKSKRANRI